MKLAPVMLRSVEIFRRLPGERRFEWAADAIFAVSKPQDALWLYFQEHLEVTGWSAPVVHGNVMSVVREGETLEICARDEVTHVR